MAFDRDADEQISEGLAYGDDDTRIMVAIHRCKDGKNRLQISRLAFTQRNGWIPAALGRLTPEEFVHAARAGISMLAELRLVEDLDQIRKDGMTI